MKITQIYKDRYQINLSAKELKVMSLIAANVGGVSWARDIMSGGEDSLLLQISNHIRPVYYAEDLNLELIGDIYINLKQKRDKRGRFCKKG